MMTTSSSIIAEFSTYEDFSSRMILLPLHDDECTGARVESHIAVSQTIDAIAGESTVDTGECQGNATEGDGDKESLDANTPMTSGHKSCATTGNDLNTNGTELSEKEKIAGNTEPVEEHDNEKHYTIVNDAKESMASTSATQKYHCDECTSPGTLVPEGYVLVKISSCHDGENNSLHQELQSLEFADILTYLRRSPFPLTLEFIPPSDFHDKSIVAESSSDILNIDSELSTNDCAISKIDENLLPISALASRDDAAKFAIQAASELRGRLSRWSYQAATLAADAATQVKELRDERQRKVKNEYQDRDGGCSIDNQIEDTMIKVSNDANMPKNISKREKTNNIGLCSMFIQTSSGFIPIQIEQSIPITNETVISIRLSTDQPCPLGWTFQWYRSTSDPTNTMMGEQSDVEKNQSDARIWALLQGASYAAYQPSMFDVGYHLHCIVKSDETHRQSCILPCQVTMEQSYIEHANNSLLRGTKSVSFGPLLGEDGVTVHWIKIVIVSNNNFISNSSVLIESTTHDNNTTTFPVLHFTVEVGPKPRQLDLISPSCGRLKFNAPNRKCRESLALALGLANYKSSIALLTPDTALFHSFANNNMAHRNDECSQHSRKSTVFDIECLLDSKDFSIAKIRHELLSVYATNQELEASLKQNLESVQLLKPTLEKYELMVTDLAQTIDNMKMSHQYTSSLQEKALKALENEKLVHLAAIEARDGKIDVLQSRIAKLETQSSLDSENQIIIEKLKNDLEHAQNKYSSAEATVAEIKAKEVELDKELLSAKENASKFAYEYEQLKIMASKQESSIKKLKAERNGLKSRAEGLTKELVRTSKNLSDSPEIQKLTQRLHDLSVENANLLEQAQITKMEKKRVEESLDATVMAHQQSIRFRVSAEAFGGPYDAHESRLWELESVISSMAEHLHAKDMQIETLKQINKALLNDN